MASSKTVRGVEDRGCREINENRISVVSSQRPSSVRVTNRNMDEYHHSRINQSTLAVLEPGQSRLSPMTASRRSSLGLSEPFFFGE